MSAPRRDEVREILAVEPSITGTALAARLGVSRQRACRIIRDARKRLRKPLIKLALDCKRPTALA